jgi:hypothetical protein
MRVSKLTIAAEYLNTAVELYFRGDAYLSALHLAGADVPGLKRLGYGRTSARRSSEGNGEGGGQFCEQINR